MFLQRDVFKVGIPLVLESLHSFDIRVDVKHTAFMGVMVPDLDIIVDWGMMMARNVSVVLSLF